MWDDYPILTPQQVKTTGWYFWRERYGTAWRIEYFDTRNRPHQVHIMGGEFIGPIPRPSN